MKKENFYNFYERFLIVVNISKNLTNFKNINKIFFIIVLLLKMR